METLGSVFGLLTFGVSPMVMYGAFLAAIVGVGLYVEMRDAWVAPEAAEAPAQRPATSASDWKPAPSGA